MSNRSPAPAAPSVVKRGCTRRTGLGTLAAGVLAAASGVRRAGAQAGGTVRRLGVHPCLPGLKLEAMMAPLAIELGQVLGTQVQIKSKPSFEAFRDALLTGQYDIVLVNPFLLVNAVDHAGYVPLVRMADELRAEILTYQTLAGGLAALRNRVLALPPRLAGASYIVNAALLEARLQPGLDVSVRHLRDQVSCLQAVSIGIADACASLSFLRGTLMTIGRSPLRSVWRSEPVAGVAIAAHPGLPPQDRIAVRAAMLGWNDSAEGRALFTALGWSRVATAELADFETARTLAARLHAAGIV